MKAKAIRHHAGCPVCVAAEQNVASALHTNRFDVEIVHLGEAKFRVAAAEAAGVKSVPAERATPRGYTVVALIRLIGPLTASKSGAKKKR